MPGHNRDHCHAYRTIEDLQAMQASGAQSKTGVVVGGGLLGLECAKALRDMGLEAHVVEFSPRLMAMQVDEGGGRVLRAKVEELGLHVHTGRNTLEITDGARARHRMVFADGTHLEGDMIVFADLTTHLAATGRTCARQKHRRTGFARLLVLPPARGWAKDVQLCSLGV